MTPEFGLQTLTVLIDDETLGPAGTKHEVWMSHRDQVVVLPPGFIAIASTPTCPIAAMRYDPQRRNLMDNERHERFVKELQETLGRVIRTSGVEGPQIGVAMLWDLQSGKLTWVSCNNLPQDLKQIHEVARQSIVEMTNKMNEIVKAPTQKQELP